MKNSQVAVLCAAILAGSLIVAGTNVWLVRSLRPAASPARPDGRARRRRRRTAGHRDDAEGEGRSVLRQLPRRRGGGGAELGVELIWDGPTGLDAAKQNELVENWITREVDVIAVAVENRGGHLDACCARRASAASRC